MLGILLLAASAASAELTDPAFGRFVPFGQLEIRIDGEALDDGEVFFDERAAAYLLRSAGLDAPLLVNVRDRRVDRVSQEKLRSNADGTVSFLTGAVAGTVGPFEVSGTQLTASLDGGRELTLGPKPHLLGLHTADDLTEHDSSYAFRARQYPPNQGTIARLREESRDVTVRVYFGSWCPSCSRVVPWILQVGEALEGSNIRFEYYGLSKQMDEPQAKEAEVHGVPTMVVSADGEELGRRSAPDLGVPEKALMEILDGG